MKILNEDRYILISAEHQSQPKRLMPLRIAHYSISALNDALDNHKMRDPKRPLPLIYPLVLYHGKGKPYPYSTELSDLIDASAELLEHSLSQTQKFQLFDLNQISLETLQKNIWAAPLFCALKFIYAADILALKDDVLLNVLRTLSTQGGRKIVYVVLRYLISKGKISDPKAFKDLIYSQFSHPIGDKIMSTAKTFVEHGIEEGLRQGIIKGELKGKLEGKREVAQRLIAEGVELRFIQKITDLSLEELQALLPISDF